jgi:hypothetical protein
MGQQALCLSPHGGSGMALLPQGHPERRIKHYAVELACQHGRVHPFLHFCFLEGFLPRSNQEQSSQLGMIDESRDPGILKEKVYKPDKKEGDDDVREAVVYGPGIAHDVGDEEPNPEDRYDG